MKKILFLILALCSAGAGYRFHTKVKQRTAGGFQDNFAEGTPGERAALLWTVFNWQRRFAPEGTYLLTGYVSVPTTSGPVGLLPGQALRVVREQGDQVVLAAPAGATTVELALPRAALTDDLDAAAHLAASDRAAHRDFRERLAAEEASREREKQSLYEAAAANVAAAERTRMGAEAIGSRASVLQHGATPRGGYHGWGSPVVVYAPNGNGATTAPTSTANRNGTVFSTAAAAPQPHPSLVVRPGAPASLPPNRWPAPTPAPTPPVGAGNGPR